MKKGILDFIEGSSTCSESKGETLTLSNLNRCMENVMIDRISIEKIMLREVPDDWTIMKWANSFGLSDIYGISVIKDKEIPNDEGWLIMSDGSVRIVKL